MQLFAQIEFRSGLILSGGPSHLWNKKLDSNSEFINAILEYEEVKFTSFIGYNAALGYKFRLEPKPKRIFYDIDLFLGIKTFSDGYLYKYSNALSTLWLHQRRDKLSFYTSLNPSFNYCLNKYFYAGAGLEPTVYFNLYNVGFRADKFDMPLTTKIGVNLKYVELALSYKIGFLNQMKSDYHKSLNLNDLQLQLYIPF